MWLASSLVPRPCAFVACSTKFAQGLGTRLKLASFPGLLRVRCRRPGNEATASDGKLGGAWERQEFDEWNARYIAFFGMLIIEDLQSASQFMLTPTSLGALLLSMPDEN